MISITKVRTLDSFSQTFTVERIWSDFDAFNLKDGTAENWLISFTTELRKKLPVGEYILTHARMYPSQFVSFITDLRLAVAPWFISELYGGFGYTYVDAQVGDLIDWVSQTSYPNLSIALQLYSNPVQCPIL